MSIPIDVLRTSVKSILSYNIANIIQAPILIDQSQIERLTEILLTSKKCVFLVGEGAVSCIDNLLALVLKLNALSVTTPLGIGLVSPYHPQFRGVIGFCGHASAMNAIQPHEVDTVVAVGTALQEEGSSSGD